MFATLARMNCPRSVLLSDPESGLRAILAIDSLDLGPAVGGIRTISYASELDAMADAARLARAMTLKCAIAGLPAGGAKTVVIDHPGLSRLQAFRKLGEFIEEFHGLYRAAGDLGTQQDDLLAVAENTRFVTTQVDMLSEAAGRGVIGCMRACVSAKGLSGLSGLKVVVQGCGMMGTGVARALAREGAEVSVADTDMERASALAEEIGGRSIDPADALYADVDIISPCALGGVIDQDNVSRIKAWAVCGAANNQLSSPDVARLLADRDILFVPDFLSSAGAVIVGVCADVSSADPKPYLEGLGRTTCEIFERARSGESTTVEIAEQIARAKVAAARRDRGLTAAIGC